MTVRAATYWKSNAHLIQDCAEKLQYLWRDDYILDPTYGRGTWWKLWKPDRLKAHSRQKDPSFDFRRLPYGDNTFDAVAYDPPYVCKGGRETSGIKEKDNRYGQDDAPATPALLQELINDGLTEMHRVVKPRGIVLVKCQDYVSSGKLWIGTHHTLTHALDLGFEVVDRLEMLRSPGSQPPGRRQVHARRNLSTLFVLKKRKSLSNAANITQGPR